MILSVMHVVHPHIVFQFDPGRIESQHILCGAKSNATALVIEIMAPLAAAYAGVPDLPSTPKTDPTLIMVPAFVPLFSLTCFWI